jgi:hypothetical protein
MVVLFFWGLAKFGLVKLGCEKPKVEEQNIFLLVPEKKFLSSRFHFWQKRMNFNFLVR